MKAPRDNADAEARQWLKQILEATNLTADADRRVKGFSGGMKRRLGIAQALLGDPELLIVDEPTAGLDPEERIRFRNLLAELAAHRLVILSSHIVEDIAQTCRDIGIIRGGRVLFAGRPGELLKQADGCVWELQLPPGERPARSPSGRVSRTPTST